MGCLHSRRRRYSNANAIPYTIFGTKGITAENVAEKLRGTKIGISSFGSESDVSITLFLRGLGLSRDRDVTVKQLPDAKVTTEDPSAYLDLSLLDELRKQGFFDQMKQMYGG